MPGRKGSTGCRRRRQGDQQLEDVHRPRLAPQRKMFRTSSSFRRKLLLSAQNDGTQTKCLRSSGQCLEVIELRVYCNKMRELTFCSFTVFEIN